MRPVQLVLRHALPLVLPFAALAAPTFHRDIEPILQAHCQSCHRPGEIGPMALLSYQDTRKWATAIKEAVALKRMPPWFESGTQEAGTQEVGTQESGTQEAGAPQGRRGHFRNDSSLSPADIQTIKAWVDSGAPEGDSKLAPPPRRFTEGWGIGQPDRVITMPEYEVPPTGTVEYTYVILPSGLTEDTWVRASEIRPGNRAVVHHAFLFVRTPGSKWFAGYPEGKAFVPTPRPGSTQKRNSDGDRTKEGSIADEQLASYVPGEEPVVLPDDTAFLVKAGSDFVLQIHYTSNGKPATDTTRIGLLYAPKPPARRGWFDGISASRFVIPPNDPNYVFETFATLATDVRLISAGPHMHLRGKSMEMRAVYPTGESETIFNVPRYDFNWQQLYEFPAPKLLPKGTRLELRATFDNSANNPHNPDPSATVRFGEQSQEEMMIGFLTLQIDRETDISRLMEPKPKPVKVP